MLPDTERQRLWSALRIAKKATLAELAEACSRGPKPERTIWNARKFMQALSRAGIVVVLPVRTKGYAPTSNGFLRYGLATDLGPLAPVPGKDSVFDPNSKSKIEYRKEAA